MLKCPTCASGLRFDIASQMLHCDACSNSYEPDLFDKVSTDAELQADLAESRPGDRGLYETAAWTCPGCGAVLMYTDDTDVTSVCAYCGSRNIMFERIRGERRPDNIVPFSVTKKDCMEIYRKRARRAFLSPGFLHRKGQVESFRGIYMPYFDYYALLDDDLTMNVEKKDVEKSSSSCDYYDVYQMKGHIKGKVLGKIHDASVRFSDDISENLGEFGEKKPFTPGYLCGFYAEADDAGVQTHAPSEQELEKKILTAIKDEMSYTKAPKCKGDLVEDGTLDVNSIDVKPKEFRAERSLYPVWFMSHRMNNGKLTYAAVNGSTGKLVADFPMSFFKVMLFALGTALVYFLLFNLVGLMPRPVPALGISMMLFMFCTIGNSFALERKLSRLNPGYKSVALIFVRVALAFMLTLAVLFVFASDSNNGWQGGMFISEHFYIAERIVAAYVTRRMLKGVDAEEMRVTYRDLRLARAIPLINLVVTIPFSLFSLIVLLVDPVNEMYYYTAVANAVCFLALFVITVLVNNFFSYRRPVQFNKKGGDDSAV